MERGPLHWFVRNFRTLFLAFGLALVVWVSSVIAANPNEERTYVNVPLDVVGKGADMLVVGDVPDTVSVTLFAPRSWLDRYQNTPGLLRASLDLSGLDQGTHEVPVQVAAELDPTRVEAVAPDSVEVTLDRLVSREKPIQLEVTGQPARGYQAGDAELGASTVTVTGAQNKVNQVSSVLARLSIENADETIETELQLRPVDSSGTAVTGVTLSPDRVSVTLPISLLAGFRNVVVRVVTTGQVATGYRLTNLTPSPPNVTVSSPNPDLVNSLPGYVETEPLDLTGLDDDTEERLALNLPPGVSVVGEQSVLVQVSVAAIDSSLSITLPVDVVGLGTGLSGQASPDTIDVILSGPIVILDVLDPADVSVFVDVTGLEPGTYTLAPQVDILDENIQVQSILPEMVEVTIVEGELPTPTPTTITETPETTGTPGISEALTPSPTP
jgi:YbbR domain-containing protein